MADAVDEHRVELLAEGKVPILSVCCCCLAERDQVVEESVQVGMKGNVTITLPVPIPWCNACWSRHRRDAWLQSQTAMLMMLIGGLFGTVWLLDKTKLSGWLAIVVLIVGTLGLMVLISLALRTLIVGYGGKDGHQPFCEGVRHGTEFTRMVEGGVEKGFQLYFANREFAARMRAAQKE